MVAQSEIKNETTFTWIAEKKSEKKIKMILQNLSFEIIEDELRNKIKFLHTPFSTINSLIL